ncbi:MAG TPA: arylsulfatase [Polyangia bacterium]|jgi:arylsulfatase
MPGDHGSKQFKGSIEVDVRQSVPDWAPFEPPQAPAGAPNVLYIVWDDVGFGAFDCYGGLIDAPAMRRVADAGVRYAQFHTTALCSPTRSCLLTGRNATSNGMACITEGAQGFPGVCGRVPFENAMLAEVLQERGWSTFAIGKWHLTPADESNPAATHRHWPCGRGFERFYGFLGGETDQWYPDLVEDNHSVEPPATPREGYHLSKDLADQAVRFIRDAKVIAPEKPWLMYFCPGAGHAPHQVWQEWSDRYRGKFDGGYEEYRTAVLARQQRLGLVPKQVELPPINVNVEAKSPDGKPWPELDTVRPWASLSADEKRLFARMAEVYAGFVSYTDAQIGRILDYLQDSGQLDNTLIVVVSDNGASGEGGPNGSVNENKFFNGVPDDIKENLKLLDVLGTEKTYNHYPTGWAMAFNTPFKLWKRYSSYEGGTADPCIVAWPKGLKARGEIRHQYTHAIDIVPTLYECLGIEPPAAVRGYTQRPLEGVSFKPTLDDTRHKVPTAKRTQFYTMLGTRGIWHQGWFACTVHPAIAGWGQFQKDRWELYHLEKDRNQLHDLAAKHPEKLEELKDLWFVEAGRYDGLPLDDRSPVEIMGSPRPQPSPPRDRYVYYPDCAPVSEHVAVNIRGRSYNIAADVTLESHDAEGVLFAHGGRFGGHALYVKGHKLHYVYNWLGEDEQKLTANLDLPPGRCVLGVRFRLEGQERGIPQGLAALYVNEQNVSERRIRTQPGNFSLTGEGLVVGRDTGQAVSSDYRAPFPFRGGTIKQVVVDVSGEPYRDLDKEMQAAIRRD